MTDRDVLGLGEDAELARLRVERDVALVDAGQNDAKLARLRRERDEARDEAARCREARHKATRDAMDAAETWWRKRTGHYRPALEQITARYIAGASAGELADIAFEALEERTSP